MDFVHYFSPFDRVGGKGHVYMYKCKCPLLSLSLLPPQRGLQQLRGEGVHGEPYTIHGDSPCTPSQVVI